VLHGEQLSPIRNALELVHTAVRERADSRVVTVWVDELFFGHGVPSP